MASIQSEATSPQPGEPAASLVLAVLNVEIPHETWGRIPGSNHTGRGAIGLARGAGEENSSYAIVDVYDNRIEVVGYRKAVSKEMKKA